MSMSEDLPLVRRFNTVYDGRRTKPRLSSTYCGKRSCFRSLERKANEMVEYSLRSLSISEVLLHIRLMASSPSPRQGNGGFPHSGATVQWLTVPRFVRIHLLDLFGGSPRCSSNSIVCEPRGVDMVSVLQSAITGS